ncbi:hypothetical protein Mgra_00009280 [Meloidogyne graminicola]|uniref:Uncharacterized protein n=1 Tax=Meloidogyne graminicola TaxID=189291 RepID=A0A8S9ZDF5_9BILA|nr:hypothetical protein Mgra_00009280 [Meloidogyne graminicola]
MTIFSRFYFSKKYLFYL